MCAINGFTGNTNRGLVDRMNAATKHRGPDGTGVFESTDITFGHNRLAIIDPDSRASQPMTDASGRYTIVFNGEIFNFKELKERFSSYPYKMESDTEAILAGWSTEGEGVLPRLLGIFAFALWDAQQHTLYLARDSAGVNPLYYRIADGNISFSSEVKGLLEDESISRTFDPRVLSTYLRLLYVPGPETAFTGIDQLPAGSVLIFRDGKAGLKKFADDSRAAYPVRISFQDAVREVRNDIQGAIQRQMLSDRPLGLLLSGGADSTIVLSEAARHAHSIDAFTVAWSGMNDGSEVRFNADARIAAKTAERFGARHHVFDLAADSVPELLEEAIWHMDVPVSSASMVSQLALAKFAKQKVDVVLSGDGGDELFGGYERYRLSLLAGLFDAVPPVRTFISFFPHAEKISDPPDARRIARYMFLKTEELAPLLSGDDEGKRALQTINQHLFAMPSAPFTQKMLWFDRESWLVDHSLIRTNKMSMAAGLEQRVPILDDCVRLFAESLPLSYKVTPFARKRVLYEAFSDVLAPIKNEPKRGWFSPGTKWLRNKRVNRLVREALSPGYWEGTAQCFDFRAIERYLDDHQSKGPAYHFTSLWAILTFQMWAKRFSVRPR